MTALRALLICGGDPEMAGFGAVCAIHAVLRERLASSRPDIFALSDIPLDCAFDADALSRIDAALHHESHHNTMMRWAPLAIQQVVWRFHRYWQYKERIGIWLKGTGATFLKVSSGSDVDLVFAARAVCRSMGIALEIGDGLTDPPTSLASFLVPHDLPEPGELSWDIVIKALAAWRRWRGEFIQYQPTGHFNGYGFAAHPWTWRTTVSLAAQVRSYFGRKFFGGVASRMPSRPSIREDVSFHLNPASWPGFDDCDLTVINSLWHEFAERYPVAHIDKLYAKLVVFLEKSKVRRIIVQQDTLTSARLLARAARACGVWCDYLPHGLIWERFSPSTETEFSPQRILAWNESSREAFDSRGLRAAVVSHPSNLAETCDLRRGNLRPLNIASLRILVLLPEWIWTSPAGRPDCHEADFVEICRGLRKVGIDRVVCKSHWVVDGLDDVRQGRLTEAADFAAVGVQFLDSRTKSSALFPEFDLVILPNTTGIIECLRSGIPLVVFRGRLKESATVAGFGLPVAETAEELAQLVSDYPFDNYEESRNNCIASLRAGPHPLAPALDPVWTGKA